MTLRRSILLALLASVPFALADGFAGFEEYTPNASDFCKPAGSDSRPVPSLPFTIQLQGRRATLSFPPNYKDSEPAPVIFAYHDTNQTVKGFRKVSRLSDNEANDFAIVVYPHAEKEGWISEPQNRDAVLEASPIGPSHDPNNDVFWTSKLIDHLGEQYCIDKKKVYAVGQGTGGGVVQILSCQRGISRRFAAFAGVNSAMLRPAKKDDAGIWGFCDVGRRPLPVMEIHGDANTKYPMVPGNDHPGLGLQDWLVLWSKLNVCGQHDGATNPSSWSDSTYVTKLKDGQITEGIVYGGGAARVSYRCSGWPEEEYSEGFERKKKAKKTDKKKDSSEDGPEIDENSRIPEPAEPYEAVPDENDEGSTIVHYSLRAVGHGWPRQELERDEEIVVNGVEVKPPGKPYFDATPVVLNWLQSHYLPDAMKMTKMARYLLLERGAARVTEEPFKPTKQQQKMINERLSVDIKDEYWKEQADGSYKLEVPIEELKRARGEHDEL